MEEVFLGQSDSVAPVFSEIESIRYTVADDGSLFFCGDLFYLFNMQRIAAFLGEDVAINILKRMASSSSIRQPNPNMSDQEAVAYLKSRYIQHPTEVQAWYTTLMDRLLSMKESFDDVNKQIKEQELAEAVAKAQNQAKEKGSSDLESSSD